MTAQSVMLSNPVTVTDTASLGQAIEILFKNRIKTVPVVDAAGVYRGLFGMHSLVRNLLPRAARLDAGASLKDLAFVHDSIESIRERLTGHIKEPVTQFLDEDAAPVAPDESLLGTLLVLDRHRRALPVVDRDSGKLLGVVTYWGVLARLTGHPA